MTINWDYPAPFTQHVSPRADDIDGLGHTNNQVYGRWCEACAWAHSAALGVTLADYQALDRGMAIVRATYDYVQASRLGDELLCGTWLSGCDGKMKMSRHFQIFRLGDGALILRGRWDFVCVELSTGRPKRLPPEFLETYAAVAIQSQ